MSTPRRGFFFGPLDSDEDSPPSPLQSHIDTLFAEFTRTRPRLSPTRTPSSDARASASHQALQQHLLNRSTSKAEPLVDLRSIDYVSDYDSHLMCPICHVPFIDPIVLDCDHTFCTVCFDEYRNGSDQNDGSECPTCRAYLLARPHKASRLIVNMCNDLKVRCPNEDCEEILSRIFIEQHATKDCPERFLNCPDSNCQKMVKRKNFVPDQCIHSSHIECDCGASIELGRGDWLKHKDEDCPTTGVKCDSCNERISVKDYLAGRNAHVCKVDATTHQCPGAEFGCVDDLTNIELESHTRTCPLARLAPTLSKQNQLLQSLTEQLATTRIRNEVLETTLSKMNDRITDDILPNLINAPFHLDLEHDNEDVEEIPRQPSPSPGGPSHHLSLPAHLRPLTPTNSDLLTLHAGLQDNISNLSSQVITLQTALSELDARTSMTMMNETLRLKEDLAHQSAGLFSTRAQVQWLLQRERERMVHGQQLQMQQQQQQRGRVGGPGLGDIDTTVNAGSGSASHQTALSSNRRATSNAAGAGSSNGGEGVALSSSSSSTNPASASGIESPTTPTPFTMGMGMMNALESHVNGNGGAYVPMSAPNSASGSGSVLLASPRVRPLRRSSGGSQERVKL